MCRWLVYSGTPVQLDELIYKPRFALIDQSLRSRLGVETTNGDGFGVGWYPVDGPPRPALFRGVAPAWNDVNLREISRSTVSPLFLAHVRASTGTAVQQTNCHPFRHENWLWAHNGSVREFARLNRYSSEGRSRSLFYSTEIAALRTLYPEDARLRRLSAETRLVVSEPLGELTGAWRPVPESSYGVIRKGDDELARFEPIAP